MTNREVAFLTEKEKVVHLDDLILRRSLMAYLDHLNRTLVFELADILAKVLGWSNAQKKKKLKEPFKS
jgi:glycerol-3-phosphate dehydrogenase